MRVPSRSQRRLPVDLITVFLCLATWITRLIYGGVLWGMYHGVWNVIPNYHHMRELWSVSLATWVLSLLFPGVGPFICTCIFVSWTGHTKCRIMEKKFLEETQTQTHFAEQWKKYVDLHKADIDKIGWDEWFHHYFKSRCDTPNIVFWVMNAFDVIVAILILIGPRIK